MKVKALVAAAIGAAFVSSVASATELRLSHQWSTKDVRHKVAEIVANHVKDANVDLDIKIFPSKSLFKPKEQYKPLSRGQLDMTVLPLSYAGGQQPSYNLTLMPGLVKNHDHAARLNYSPFMDAVQEKMAEGHPPKAQKARKEKISEGLGIIPTGLPGSNNSPQVFRTTTIAIVTAITIYPIASTKLRISSSIVYIALI